MTRFITSTFHGFIELITWIYLIGFVVAGGIIANNAARSNYDPSGAVFGFTVLGVLLGFVAGLIFAVLTFGAILLVFDIREALLRMENLTDNVRQDLKRVHKELEKSREAQKEMVAGAMGQAQAGPPPSF